MSVSAGNREQFLKATVDNILGCTCSRSQTDTFYIQQAPSEYVDQIIQGAIRLFSLLVHVQHPRLIIGFLNCGCDDTALNKSNSLTTMFSCGQLKKYTGSYYTKKNADFQFFHWSFTKAYPEFTVPYMDSGEFAQYDRNVVLPFIEEREVGMRLNEGGRYTSESGSGRLIAFKICKEYRRFPASLALYYFLA